MKKILLGILFFTSLIFAGETNVINKDYKLTENVKYLLKEGGVSIIEYENELNVKKEILKVEKELYCFSFYYGKKPYVWGYDVPYQTIKLKPVEYDYSWKYFLGNIEAYCFLTEEEAEKAKIEKQEEIKEIIKTVKKEKLIENIAIGIGITIILIVYLTLLYYIVLYLKKILK